MTNLAGYEVITQIHESANSIVYRGRRNVGDNEPVILKVLKQEYPTPEQITRYKREYEIVQSLTIDGVTRAYSLQKYQNTLVMILEDFGAQSLKKMMAVNNFTLLEFLQIALRITEILSQIHSANIIHKDLTPDNIIFNPKTGILKIIDFGISTVLYRENPTITNHTVLEGTLPYISPEQTGRMNRSLDYRSDFYSLGVTFYELLTHQLPFNTNDPMELVHCHIAKQPVPPHELNPEIPSSVSDIVMKLLAKTAEKRYQSSWGIQADLRSCLNQLETNGAISEFTLGEQDISDKFQIPQKLYGRKREVETLLTAFERVSSGTVEMMLVTGYSGIGKSALVQEIYNPITRHRGYFISGKFDQFRRNIPYSAIVSTFQSLIRQLLTESAEALSLWKEKLQRALGPNGQLIIDVVPEVELIVGPQPDVQKLGPEQSKNRFNLLFQNFIRVFCSPAHPLVIFLDDLQWVDSATLKLIEIIMTDEDMRYLFLIGAYRDNEVDATHPLMMTVNSLHNKRAIINQITLFPLQLEQIAQLIAETLHSDTESVKPLASLVEHKTQGNPFFINQFLKTLYAENLLRFILNAWQWDIAQIEALEITENVVDLMIGRLKKLPDSTQLVLQLAACVGNRFDLNTLAIIHKESVAQTFENLLPVIQLGLILPTSDFKPTSLEISKADLVIDNYKFLHDRVQQSAYALIQQKLQKSVHLEIGQLLLANISTESRTERIFEIVDHLNIGRELITDDRQKLELATLNLAAGQKAKDALAYAAALQYLTVGMESLPGDIWAENYALAFTLHKERAEVEYLNGNFEQSEALIKIMLSHAKSAIEKAEVHNMLIVLYTLLAKYEEAIQAGRKALSLLGIDLPEKLEDLQVSLTLELAEAKLFCADKEIASLIDKDKMTEPQQQVALKLLGNMGPLTFFSHQELWKMTVVKAINLSFKYGLVAGGSYCYSCYGIILSAMLGDYQSGYDFGLLSLKLSEISNNLAQNCQDSVIFANYLNCWLNHIKTTNVINNESYQVGLHSGNLQWAGYNRMFQTITLFYQGVNLASTLNDISNFMLFCQKTKNQWATDIMLANQLAIYHLRGQHNEVKESEYLVKFYQHKSMAAVCEYHVLKTQVFYIYEQYQAAKNWAFSALELLNYLMGHISSSHHNFYYSLILTALYPAASKAEQKHYLETVAVNQKQMKIWAEQCPENFLHKYLLVEAEIARIYGKVASAMDLYDRAIESAREYEFTQNEALANELAAKFWLAQGKEEFAKLYMKKAHYGYQLWGAFGKVKDLEEKFPYLLAKTTVDLEISNTITTLPTRNANSNPLDLNTVVKASQAISSEIVLSSLLNKLMKIVIENAGAQLGLFLTKQNDVWVIEVEGTVDRENMTVLQSLNFGTNRFVPLSIIYYVERTKENLVIDDGSSDERFCNDPYILSNQPKSILCSPIIYQGKLTGILYLENQLITGVFTPQRLKLLNLLTAQVAISLENAKLYTGLREFNETLETQVASRTAQLAAANTELDSFSYSVSHDLRAPLRHVGGFVNALAQHLQRTGASADPKVTHYLKVIHDSSQKMGQLIDGLLTLSRMGRRQLEKQPVNLLTLVQTAIALAKSQIADRAIEFVVGDLPTVMGDATLLQQVFTNLLDNAVKFTRDRSPARIAVGILEDNTIFVRDNGVGFDMAYADQLFAAFQRLHSETSFEGTGIGLAIVQRIIHRHGGTIWAESQPDVGTTFYFKIDASPEE